MNFIVDENLSPELAIDLRNIGFNAIHIKSIGQSLQDLGILIEAVYRESVIITRDSDFGEMLFRDQLPPPYGLLFIRDRNQLLPDDREMAFTFIRDNAEMLVNSYITLKHTGQYRIRPLVQR